MYDWNDLRAFLAVAREGSTLAASRSLGINQTTVARRIEALEGRLRLKLFERGQSGSRISEAGLALLAEAEAVEAAAARFMQKASVQQRGLGGTIRVTASEGAANMVLTPALPEFRSQYPDVIVELVLTDAHLDLQAGEADIAIRGAAALPDSNLVARKVSEVLFAPYCSFDYARKHGLPTIETLGRHHVIGPEGHLVNVPGMAALMARARDADISYRCNSMINLTLAVQSGVGVGLLPCPVGDSDPDLIMVYPPDEDTRAGTWVVTRPEMKNVPRVRAFIDFIAPYFVASTQGLDARAAAIRGEKAARVAELFGAAQPPAQAAVSPPA